ncbi:MAG TPA: hypothetical protein VFF78_04580 [Anaerolineaceae bacterium]|nr:hypothetical protein [Anaerolineaceae bacterium]
MNIYTFKTQLESELHPAPLHTLVSAEQAWGYFKTAMSEYLEDADCEELGFSASVASHYDGNKTQVDENLFQIYFGRLIDAKKGHPWHTAEINFYYRYAMNAELRSLLNELPQQDIEVAYCASEDAGIIRQKIDTVFTFADGHPAIWDAIRELSPTLASFHFWIQ